jgi:hypothetical protein
MSLYIIFNYKYNLMEFLQNLSQAATPELQSALFQSKVI